MILNDLKLDEVINNRDMLVPNYTMEQVAKIPNIFQLIDYIKKKEFNNLDPNNVWKGSNQFGMFLAPFIHIDNPDACYVNDAKADNFIVNRLSSGKFSLKPNLRILRFLFRGQKQHFANIKSSFKRGKHDDRLISNLKAEEFMAMLRTHPLFMLLEHDVHLDGMKKPFFLEMNYYGLAQHYNFNTGLVDFTSDISVAAFFATTMNMGDDKYEPYGGSKDNPVGVIYIHEIKPQFSFVFGGFRTIGQQLYPRTGAQKGFFYQEDGTRLPIEQQVIPYFFRHDIICSKKKISEWMNQSQKLFPADNLSVLAQDILHSDEVSGETFARNLYTNQDDFNTNLNRLANKNIKVNWHTKRVFTADLLKQYYQDVKNGMWENFRQSISFFDEQEDKFKESLLNLPSNPHYSQYFEEKQLDRL